MRIVREPIERFFSHIIIADAPPVFRPDLDPCWLWQGSTTKNGYGQMRIAGKLVLVHVFAYTTFLTAVRCELDHLCRVRNCANPTHVEDVPHSVNLQRGMKSNQNVSKTTCPRGHPYDYIEPKGRRHCRTCRAVSYQRFIARHAA